jgi:chemotaxis protein histidine kinase CheA
MKKFITIWIGCSLALAVGALAQQEEAQPTPTKKQRHKAKSEQAAQPSAGQPAQQAPAAGPRAGKRAKERAPAPNKPHAQAPATNPHSQAPATGPTDAGANSNDAQAEQKKSRKGPRATSSPHEQAPATGPTDTGANSNDAQAEQKKGRKGQRATSEPANTPHAPAATNAKTKSQSETTATTATSEQAGEPTRGKGKAKQVDVQKIKTQHANFRAQPKPEQVPAVTFSETRQISGSDQWQGTQYTVFRSYRPQWHDQNWYRSHYNRVELFAGGYYFFNAGYWYPAWGYQPTAQYYVYDGPIYAGSRAEPPDRVIADVQAALQEMGYYRGEVDGLLGPLTREALTGYQTDNGLYTTAAIDQPTLDSLGI